MRLVIENVKEFNGVFENTINTMIYAEEHEQQKYSKKEILSTLKKQNNKHFNNRYKIGSGSSHIWISGQDNERYAIIFF